MMRTAAEGEQVIWGKTLESVARVAERAGHGLAALGCSDGVRFGFVRREVGAPAAMRRCRGWGSFGSQGAADLCSVNRRGSLGRA
jgi:hypothetical protein